ncbi:glycoside hydrolase family 97 protein [Segatella copri]|uniref:glycoside hydrolase family 97 protein n=1 Tax=Segatella copri TaxID=165179 RepID=UPI00193270D0|nr:glycoside hydrolase family 97 protein [Segatella copri]MBM0142972.1 glycoside hydrolase family 97 protein [Segatella copri]
MRKFFIAILFWAVAIVGYAAEALQSPGGKYNFVFEQKDGRLTYRLDYAAKQVIEEGELGVNIDNHLVESAMGIPVDNSNVWTNGMEVTSVDRCSEDNTWKPVYGEYAQMRDHYNEMTIHLLKGGKHEGSGTAYDKRQQYLLDIIVRAYDEGVAIRYHFPEATNGLFMHITDDLTSFRFAPGAEAYHYAWAQAHANKVKLLKSEAAWKDEAERPLTLQLANGLYAAIGEAALTDFVRGKLKLKADNELQMAMFDSADIITAYDMPWRFIMVGEKTIDLINNKQMVLNLNAPCQISDTYWIKPGKAFRVCRLDMKTCMEGVDFCVDRGLQYIELDAGWYGPEMKMSSSALKVLETRDIDMPKLCQYAKSKGIGVWVYVNQRALYQELDQILPLYEKWGISGIKFGFVQIGSQEWTTWLHNAVKKCADHHIMVDIHDEYRPTGWSRTYPNLMTQEGIGGNEEMPDAEHNTILPFTRFLCGPADYTPCYFNGRVKNTKAHQLAMPVVYYSPITFLYWYDLPNVYKGEKELDFWKYCPTVWDESKALQGEIGEYIVQARRSGNDWFVGAMNGLQARDITLNTADFLLKGKKYRVEIYNDEPSLTTRTKVSIVVQTIKAGKILKLHLQPSGGAALRFSLLK